MKKKDGRFKISWHRFYENCKADFKLWWFFILFQQICRLYFISALSNYLASDTKLTTILYAMIYGLRFDSLWATCWLFFALVFLTVPSLFITRISNDITQKYRRYLGGVFTAITALIYVASVEYFREYKDVFNQFLFSWFYDDKVAILKTIYAQHHVVANFTVLALLLLLYTKFSPYFIRNGQSTNSVRYSVVRKTMLSIAIVGFYVIGFRGGVGHRPVQLKDAGITTDAFLNKVVVSPYSSLKYAINEYRQIKQEGQNDANLSLQEIQEIAKKFFSTDRQYPTLARYMEKTAKGTTLFTPKHVFLIIGESLDAWSLQDQYRKFNLTSNLQQLIANGSIYFKHFLPCTNGTMETINTILTGIQDAGMHINYQRNNNFPTALAVQFKKLGFKPQFFYGGYLSWQHVGDFAKSQGFDSVYGAAHIKNWRQTNEWGVDDRTLFDFIINTIKSAKTSTFNVIMTTSNHPPFSINLEQEGFNKKNIEKLLAQYPSTNTNVKELGHIWYADKAIGEFVKKMTAIDNTSLFAITGDHFGRRHVLPNAPLFDTSAVPLIIYGVKVKEYCNLHNCKATNAIAGSHLDLAATLIELIAPKGFTYYAIGDNLLAKRKFNIGIGKDVIITPSFIAAANNADIMYFKKSDNLIEQIGFLKERLKQAKYIERYLIKKGDIKVATAHQTNKINI